MTCVGGCVSGLKVAFKTSTSTSTFQLSRQVSKRQYHTSKSVNRSERMKFVDPIESESTRERTPSQGILNRCLLVELFLLEFFSFLGYYLASGVIPYCTVKFRKKKPPCISPPKFPPWKFAHKYKVNDKAKTVISPISQTRSLLNVYHDLPEICRQPSLSCLAKQFYNFEY